MALPLPDVSVHPPQLLRAAHRLDGIAADLAATIAHDRVLTAVPPGTAAAGSLVRLAIAMAGWLRQTGEEATATGTGLRGAAAAYVESDRRGARQLAGARP